MAALLLGCAAVPARAQDAQSLVAKNLEARGGAAALAAIKNVSFEGRTIFPGDFEVTYKETRARAGAAPPIRVDFGLQGLDIIQAYDGHGGVEDQSAAGPQGRREDVRRRSAVARRRAR